MHRFMTCPERDGELAELEVRVDPANARVERIISCTLLARSPRAQCQRSCMCKLNRQRPS